MICGVSRPDGDQRTRRPTSLLSALGRRRTFPRPASWPVPRRPTPAPGCRLPASRGRPGAKPDGCAPRPDRRSGERDDRAARAAAGTNGQARRTAGRPPGSNHGKTGRIDPAIPTHRQELVLAHRIVRRHEEPLPATTERRARRKERTARTRIPAGTANTGIVASAVTSKRPSSPDAGDRRNRTGSPCSRRRIQYGLAFPLDTGR